MEGGFKAIDFGSLRRLVPVSRRFGFDRGLPIDRYYIEQFLSRYAGDIRGRVVEMGDDTYIRMFGGAAVTTRDVLFVAEGNPKATFVGDLTSADHIPSGMFDCIIVTQTLQFIYDVRAAIKTLGRILKPGGVVLATFPGITSIASDQWGDDQSWSFTALSARRLFEEVFSASNVRVETFGNLMAAVAFLHGLATKELSAAELQAHDPEYELLVTVRALKSE